ncbi:MAG: S9 family peptidase [Anaerolineales bacterium]|nr:S9 family peptidase [Anaerolineales bacterium]
MIDLEKLLRVPYVDSYHGFDISPDGKRVAFSWNKSGQWELFEFPLSASDAPEPVSSPKEAPVTEAPSPKGRGRGVMASSFEIFLAPTPLSLGEGLAGAKFAPKYSPESSRLAFAVDFDGSENFHIFVHDFETGAHTDLTPNINFALQPNFCWSPDGKQIAFISNQSGNFDVYVMSSTGGAARCVLAIQRPAWDVHWSPDGKWLAVTFESKGQDYGVYLVSMNAEKSFPLADGNGPINAHNPSWSPDSTKLAFHSDAPNGWHQIGIFDLYSHEITWLTSDEANHRSPSWSKDGTMLIYIRAQGASDEIVVQPLDGEARTYQVEDGVHYKPRFTPDGEHVIFVFNNPRFPPDLWKLSLDNGELSQLTYSLPDDMDDEPYLMPEEITYPGMDSTPIPALLFKPEYASNNTPAVLIIHGGPNWHYQMEWYPLMIHLVSRGWTVLAPNYRGSTGYGREWQYANRFDLGGVDTDDVAAGTQFLLHEKLADPTKIAVTGRSHGGYLTMTNLTQYPELWAVGSGVVPFTNWFNCHVRSRDDLKHWDVEMMGHPNHNHDLWYERSPYFFLDRIRVPVQLICGEHDPRCPAEDSLETRDKLLELGKQVDFHLYEGEGHAFLKIENVVDSEVRRVEFLAHFLERQ